MSDSIDSLDIPPETILQKALDIVQSDPTVTSALIILHHEHPQSAFSNKLYVSGFSGIELIAALQIALNQVITSMQSS